MSALHHAQVLAFTILRLVKEALSFEGIREIQEHLPEDWSRMIERI